MTRRAGISVTLAILVVFAYAATVSWIAEVKIDRMQERMSNMECRHVLYEDGSSLHKDAELSMLCMRNGG